MNTKFKYLLFIQIVFYNNLFAQNLNIDSIKHVINTSRADTNKVRALLDLSWELSATNIDTAILVTKQALALSKKLNWENGTAGAHHDIASLYFDQGNYSQSLEHNEAALKLLKKMDKKTLPANKPGIQDRIANTLGNIGRVYSDKGDYPNALKYYFRALKIAEKYKNTFRMSVQYGNLGIVYTLIKEYDKASRFYNRALQIAEEEKNELGIMSQQFNIASMYHVSVTKDMPDSVKKINYTFALENYMKVLKRCDKPEYISNKSVILTNIGSIYDEMNQSGKAIEQYLNALSIDEQFGNKGSIARILGNIGFSYYKLNKLTISETYLKKSLQLCDELGILNEKMNCENYLYELYTKMRNYKLAFEHYKSYAFLKDSIFNEEKSKELTRHELSYEFEKKIAAAKSKQDKKDAIAKEELKRKEQQRNYFIIGFALVLILALFILRGFRQKQKANILISQQKLEVEMKNEIIEEKQKEILDSIRYAKRIQMALLPTNKYVEKNLERMKSTK